MNTGIIKNKKFILVFAIIIVISLIGVLIINNTLQNNKFQRVTKAMLEEYPYANYELAADCSYLKMNTFIGTDILSQNKMGYGFNHEDDTYNGIKFVNKKLGFKDVVINKMDNTTTAMGIQTAENKDYIVTWSLDPYYGLKVIYEHK